MNDKEKLDKAISLLREWIYELAPLDEPETVDVLVVARDFSRMSGNTVFFLKNECSIDLENT